MRIAQRLPENSHYKAEIADSDEYAQRMLARQEESAQRPRTMHGFTPELAALYEIADRVGALYAVTIAVNSKNGKAPDVPPLPRPQTAAQRVESNKTLERHHNRVRQMLGG